MSKYYIGVLSGTSMDAISVAAFHFSPLKVIASMTYPIPAEFKQNCMNITQGETVKISELGKLDSQAGELFGQAVLSLIQEYKLSHKDIIAIGSHGQNIFHSPNTKPAVTIQIGDPSIIAYKTKITTIADFRRKDIAAGGQGAPLSPAFHHEFFSNSEEQRVILNLGGIANITFLNPGNQVIGFDTGPANCLMDEIANRRLNQAYDANGATASKGRVISSLLDKLLADDYFSLPHPKSTGREHFNSSWLNNLLSGHETTEDLLATLTELTVQTVVASIKKLTDNEVKLYVCGGGAYNQYLLNRLGEYYPASSTTELGIKPEWVETALFAWLARQNLRSMPANLPSVTGAKQPVILGGVYK